MLEPTAARPETILQHLGEEDHLYGAVVPPIFQNSLFVHDSCADFERSFDPASTDERRYSYSRVGNPTLEVVERKMAALEHCESAKVFGSGMAAISAAILSCVQSGSHVVCVDTVYGPSRIFLTDYLSRFGVTTTIVSGLDVDEVLSAVRPETTLILLESPSTFVFRMQDLRAIASFARERGIATATDNSYSTPIFQTPADQGVDIVLHSATKYLGGHSDLTAGVLACSRERMTKIIANEVSLLGGALAPFPAWLLLRGLRTLAIRMRAHEAAGNAVARWLSARPEVECVNHVGLPSHPQRDLIERTMRGSGGLLTFQPKVQDPVRIKAFADRLKVFQLGVSWGGFESLCVPAPYHPMDWPEPRWLIRLYCGLEAHEDLIADLEQAMVELA